MRLSLRIFLLSCAMVATALIIPVVRKTGEQNAFILISASIVGVFVYSVVVLVTKRKSPPMAVIYQIFLFCFLHQQIYRTFGASHYQVFRHPNWGSWLSFVGAHVVRAVDVLDFFEEYRINIQTIHINSILSGSVTVTMHWLLDIFLLAIMLQRNWRNRLVSFSEQYVKPTLMIFIISMFITSVFPYAVIVSLPALFLLLVFGIVRIIFVIKQWRKQWLPYTKKYWALVFVIFIFVYIRQVAMEGRVVDAVFWWPLDNFVRLIDIGDSLQIFQWKLHRLPENAVNSTLSLIFRLGLGVIIAQSITKIRVLYFKGVGLTFEELAENLVNPDPEIREAAARELESHAEEAQEVISILVEDLAHRESREKVMAMLDKVDPNWRKNDYANQGIKNLLRDMINPDQEVRERIRETLEIFDSKWRYHKITIQMTSYFSSYLSSKKKYYRMAALEGIGADPAKTVPKIIKALNDKEWEVRKIAVELLGKMAEIAKNAVDKITLRLIDKEPQVSDSAIKALDQLNPEWRKCKIIHDFLAKMLKKKDPFLRWLFKLLIYFPLNKKKFWEIYKRGNFHETRKAAARAIGELGVDGKSLIPQLTKALKDRDQDVVNAVQSALNKVGG